MGASSSQLVARAPCEFGVISRTLKRATLRPNKWHSAARARTVLVPVSSIGRLILALFMTLAAGLYVDASQAQTARAADILRRLRALARSQRAAHAPAGLNTLVTELHELLQTDALVHGVQLTLELAPDMPEVGWPDFAAAAQRTESTRNC